MKTNISFDLILIFEGPVGWGGGNASDSDYGHKVESTSVLPNLLHSSEGRLLLYMQGPWGCLSFPLL